MHVELLANVNKRIIQMQQLHHSHHYPTEDAADGAVRFQGNDLLSLDDEGMRAARRDVQLDFRNW